MLKRILSRVTHNMYSLPVLILMPHSRCNCRCVMCDIWKANSQKKELSVELLQRHLMSFVKLGVREVVLSGGEALMHSNLWMFCALLKKNNMRVVLLSTGLLLEKSAGEIIENLDEVIVSLDGSREVHDRIRNIPDGYEKISRGIQFIKKLEPTFKITARCVLQRYNFHDYINTVTSAKAIGLDSISFLAADVSTTAFNRSEGWSEDRVSEVALTKSETDEFEGIIKKSFDVLKNEYASGFIMESPKKMLRLVNYYKAINAQVDFLAPPCNAPWVSAVVESDGTVFPCFFHKPYPGNVHEDDFLKIINSPEAIRFRKSLNVKSNPTCRKCVCSLHLGLTKME